MKMKLRKKTKKIVTKAIKEQIFTQKNELTHFAEAFNKSPSGMTRNYLIRSAKEVSTLEDLLPEYEADEVDR